MPGKQKLILIIDDEENIKTLLSNKLKKSNFKCILASSMSEGLNIVQNNKVDLIISDIRMPEGDGIEFIQKMRNELQFDCPVIFMSGYPDYRKEEIVKIMPLNIYKKPFSLNELTEFVISYLSHES